MGRVHGVDGRSPDPAALPLAHGVKALIGSLRSSSKARVPRMSGQASALWGGSWRRRSRSRGLSAAMPMLAIVLLAVGWLGILPMGTLAVSEHGLMMPVMLIR
jgi:hypothetical protein